LIDLFVDAKVSSRELYKIGEYIRALRKAVAKLQRHRGTGVNIADSRNALSKVWSCRRFEKTGCLAEGILEQCIIFTRYIFCVSNIF